MSKKKLILRIVIAVVAAILIAALTLTAIGFIRYWSLEDTGLPRIEIVTDHNASIVSKTDYVNCKISVSETDEEFCFEDATAKIRGRGNDTWNSYPKKPYRIKFTEKTSMFGESENRSWVLLAMYNDFSYTKDRMAYALADRLGADFSPCYHYVDLYLNGEYRGVYLLTDQVDENEGRTDVQEKINPNDTEVPFLVELDAYGNTEGEDGIHWFGVSGSVYNVKYPDETERYTQAQFEYIRQYIETVDALCRKPGVTMAELSEYVDMDSFINYFIVQEVMGQNEINWKSVYMSKSIDGKLKMGPVWDYDWAATGPSLGDDAETWREAYEGLRSKTNWFALLYAGSPEFKSALQARWSEVKDDVLDVIEEVEDGKETLDRATERDHLRWHWYRLGHSYDDYFEELIHWSKKRVAWLDREFSPTV